MRITLAIGIALFVAPVVTSAQSQCANAVSQIDLNACAGAGTEEASALLTRLLDKLRETLPAERLQSLATVQRQWSDFMEAHCRWESDAFKGGSIQPLLIAECRTALTDARIQRLSAQLFEGTGTTANCVAARPYVRRGSAPKPRRVPTAKPLR